MKQRTGFVSNSSSSSFIVCSKELITEELFTKVLGILPHCIFYEDYARMAQNLTMIPKEEYEDYITDEMIKYLNQGWHMYVGSASDNPYGPETALCYSKGKVFLNDIILIKEEDSY